VKAFTYHILLLLKRVLLIIVLLTLSRILFYAFNQHLFGELHGPELYKILFYGIKFDLASIVFFNALFIVLSLAPLNLLSNNWYQIILKWLYCLVNAFILALNFIDTKFYEFAGKRITSDVFNSKWLGDDFSTMLPHFLADYWYMFILFGVFVFIMVKLYPSYSSRYIRLNSTAVVKISNRWIIRVIIIAFFVLVSRGGFQLKPINVISATQYTKPVNVPLILNSSFTLIKSIGGKNLTDYKPFTERDLDNLFSPVIQFDSVSFKNKNVIVIILESFGREYSGLLNHNKGYVPNFDSIQQKGLYFTQCYANGKRSIEALPSILSSIPALMDEPFITSSYNVNSIESLGSILASLGYETRFYHGGKNGTMGFDNFVKLVGINHYYGLNEYPDRKDYDGGWGIFDEPYLKYFANQLTEIKEPFFAGLFTLSSHHPYTIPDQYANKFPKGKLVNLESIGYADYALGKFFETAQKEPWFYNTLFVLTADHTAQTNGGFYKTEMGKYAVPLVFYSPGDSTLVGQSSIKCSQSDILPSVLDYLGYNKPFVSFGQSVFRDSVPHYAANYVNGVYQLITDSLAITSNGKDLITAFAIKGNDIITRYNVNDTLPAEVERTFLFQKAMIQQYISRMIENKLNISE